VTRTTKGTIEAEVANAVVRFHREQQGRGPIEVKASVLGDMVLVRCAGIFTPTEARLSATEDGRKIIRSARQELRSINHCELEAIVSGIVGAAVLRSYYDMDVQSAEQIEVFVLEADLEKRLLRQELDHLNSLAPHRKP
jgi:uncharacterized protein YbcI